MKNNLLYVKRQNTVAVYKWDTNYLVEITYKMLYYQCFKFVMQILIFNYFDSTSPSKPYREPSQSVPCPHLGIHNGMLPVCLSIILLSSHQEELALSFSLSSKFLLIWLLEEASPLLILIIIKPMSVPRVLYFYVPRACNPLQDPMQMSCPVMHEHNQPNTQESPI